MDDYVFTSNIVLEPIKTDNIKLFLDTNNYRRGLSHSRASGAQLYYLDLPDKSGTVALTSDIPALSSSTKLGVEEIAENPYSTQDEVTAFMAAIANIPSGCVMVKAYTERSSGSSYIRGKAIYIEELLERKVLIQI